MMMMMMTADAETAGITFDVADTGRQTDRQRQKSNGILFDVNERGRLFTHYTALSSSILSDQLSLAAV